AARPPGGEIELPELDLTAHAEKLELDLLSRGRHLRRKQLEHAQSIRNYVRDTRAMSVNLYLASPFPLAPDPVKTDLRSARHRTLAPGPSRPRLRSGSALATPQGRGTRRRRLRERGACAPPLPRAACRIRRRRAS